MIEAARQSGSPKILAQSVAWQLPDGPDAQAVAELERSVLAEGGVVLRYGQFYGPGTYNEQQPPRNLGFISTGLPNGRWQRWASHRASSSLSTEHASSLPRIRLVGNVLRLVGIRGPAGGIFRQRWGHRLDEWNVTQHAADVGRLLAPVNAEASEQPRSYLATFTRQCARAITSCETEPSTSRATPPLPPVPTTMWSI